MIQQFFLFFIEGIISSRGKDKKGVGEGLKTSCRSQLGSWVQTLHKEDGCGELGFRDWGN